MKVGIEVQIDVTKIDKARLYQGKKGNYLTLTTFVDLDAVDQYDNSGFVTQKKTKDEGKDVKLPILGNTKVFWKEDGAVQQAPEATISQNTVTAVPDNFDDIPF